jgi:hypothetical protein
MHGAVEIGRLYRLSVAHLYWEDASPCYGRCYYHLSRLHYEYVVISANPPGIRGIPVAVLLRSVTDDRLDARVRDDLRDVLDCDSAEIVRGTVRVFVERATVIGGAALLAELEATLSNFLTISSRSSTVGAGDPNTLLSTLAGEHLSRRS